MPLIASIQLAIDSYVNHHLLVAAFLGALIGLERELAGKDPSLRTFTLISMGSCTFSLLSVHAATLATSAGHPSDPGRIAAQIVTGIGFLGAGVIFRSSRGVSGYTTAAMIWMTAAIGMAVGFDRIDLGVSATVLALFFTYFLKIVHWVLKLFRPSKPGTVE